MSKDNEASVPAKCGNDLIMPNRGRIKCGDTWNGEKRLCYECQSKSKPATVAREPETATMNLEIERETDGRWIAEWTNYPGCMAYGATRGEAVRKATDLLFEVAGKQHGAPSVEPAVEERVDDTQELSKFRLMFYNAMNIGALQGFPNADDCEVWLNNICDQAARASSGTPNCPHLNLIHAGNASHAPKCSDCGQEINVTYSSGTPEIPDHNTCDDCKKPLTHWIDGSGQVVCNSCYEKYGAGDALGVDAARIGDKRKSAPHLGPCTICGSDLICEHDLAFAKASTRTPATTDTCAAPAVAGRTQGDIESALQRQPMPQVLAFIEENWPEFSLRKWVENVGAALRESAREAPSEDTWLEEAAREISRLQGRVSSSGLDTGEILEIIERVRREASPEAPARTPAQASETWICEGAKINGGNIVTATLSNGKTVASPNPSGKGEKS